MSYLGQTITWLIEENRVTQKWIESKTGICQSTISRWQNGQQTSICCEDLARLAGALGRTKCQQAELIAAHLRDECHGPGAELIEINIRGDTGPSTKNPFETKLPARTEKALNLLVNLIPVRPGLEQMIIGLAAALASNDASPESKVWSANGAMGDNGFSKPDQHHSPTQNARRADVCTA